MTEKVLLAGIDDATKCPCIGSIFLAGVVADPKTIRQWKKAGVKDSKLVAKKKREKLEQLIKETATCYWIEQLTPQQIDQKTINLNAWEMLTVAKILDRLTEKTKIREVIIDNWEVNCNLFEKRWLAVQTLSQSKEINWDRLKNLQLKPEHKADVNHIVVGAASILAKTASDGQLLELQNQYGDIGSGSPGDPRTRLFVWQNRKSPPVCVRQSWNTFKTLSICKKPEDDWILKRYLKGERVGRYKKI